MDFISRLDSSSSIIDFNLINAPKESERGEKRAHCSMDVAITKEISPCSSSSNRKKKYKLSNLLNIDTSETVNANNNAVFQQNNITAEKLNMVPENRVEFLKLVSIKATNTQKIVLQFSN